MTVKLVPAKCGCNGCIYDTPEPCEAMKGDWDHRPCCDGDEMIYVEVKEDDGREK